MASIPSPPDLIDEIQLFAPRGPDRLPAMLFLAALVHGVLIMGVTFNASFTDFRSDAISLEVTIVADPDQRIDEPEAAEYIAQASQQGGGNTRERVRASAPVRNTAPVDNIGVEDGDSPVDARVHERSADELLSSRTEQQLKVTEDPRRQPQETSSVAIALESGSTETLPLPQEDTESPRIRDDELRQLVVSADTRESIIAAYLDGWKRRVETVGDAYFPELGNMDGISGSPTLEVSIEASGQLSEVILRRSSGSRVVDQAALDILRRAAPFDPFPADIQAEYDRLRFAYKWVFDEQRVSVSTRADSPGRSQ